MGHTGSGREHPPGGGRKTARWPGVVALLALLAGLAWPAASVAEQLPVFKLTGPKVDKGQAAGILANLHDGKLPPGAQVEERPEVYIHRAGKKEVEVQKASGGIFMRDVEKLWNPNIMPALPSRDEARGLADKFLADNRLIPAGDRRVKVSFAGYSETAAATEALERVEKKVLDIQVNYRAEIAVRGPEGKELTLPVVGGGGKFKVAIGSAGEVVGYHGVWRPISAVASQEEVLPRAEAEARVRKMLGDLKVTGTDSFLAYYSAPAFEEQTHLAPVWVVKAQAEIGGQVLPLRNTIVAATRYGPEMPEVPAKARPKDQKPTPQSLDGDENASLRGGVLELLLGTAWAEAAREAGTSWIGPSQGLAGSPANAKGFVDGLAAAGWRINFNWGESSAFESDWNRDDDSWVDAADFVFYTGHAGPNGWVLNNPDDTGLSYGEVGSTPGNTSDLYGQGDLEWIIIAACGPHQSSHFTTGVGNAFDRWRGIFDGLHVFMGYGAVTYDNTTEGARVVELARAGWPIIDAWFRTAWEIQPSTNGYGAPNGPTIYVTAMYAHTGDHATRYDHIWGSGTTVSDPVGSGQRRTLMWSGT